MPCPATGGRACNGIPPELAFTSWEELLARPQMADAALICTLDDMHTAPALAALRQGYHILLEKPMSNKEAECRAIARAAEESGRILSVCHVLRYTPFYRTIKRLIDEGQIGQVASLCQIENVGYWHQAHSFVRGNWRSSKVSPMILQKSCHDIDILLWLAGQRCTQVASFGCDFQFDPAKKPAGAGKRCLVDCKIEEQCLYSAKKHYIDHPDRWAFYVWDCLEHLDHPTIEDKIQSLKTDNIHGRCVWDCNHSVVDHQSVLLNFADGATATLNMIGGTTKPERNIHIIGTKGEIKGVFDDSVFVVRTIDTPSESGYREEVVDLKIGGDKSGMTGSHGGGDLRLVEDFVRVLQGAEPSVSCTSIQDSVRGHRAVFRAEAARKTGTVQPME